MGERLSQSTERFSFIIFSIFSLPLGHFQRDVLQKLNKNLSESALKIIAALKSDFLQLR